MTRVGPSQMEVSQNAAYLFLMLTSSWFWPTVARFVLLTAQGAPSLSPTLADVLEGPVPEWAKEGQGWDIDATLDEAGFETIEKLDVFPTTTYRDIGAVVYVLRAVPWIITDFTVEGYRERLYRLHLHIKREGGFTTQGHQRLLEMRKPGKSIPSVKGEDNSL
jgi:hypothetical protein